LKIVFCLRNFLPGSVGGTEVYVDALCIELKKLGAETVVVKPGFDKKEISQYLYNDYRVIEYPQSSYNDKSLIVGEAYPDGLPMFEQIMLDEKPDLVHFHEISGSNGITLHHMALVKKMQIPLFMTFHLAGYVCKTGQFRFIDKIPCNGVINEYKCAVCTLKERGVPLVAAATAALAGLPFKRATLRGRGKWGARLKSLISYPHYIWQHREALNTVFNYAEKVFVLSEWFFKVLRDNQAPSEKMVQLKKALPFRPRLHSVQTNKDSAIIKLVYLGRISRIKGLHILLDALNQVQYTNWTLTIYGQVGEQDYMQFCRELSENNETRISFKDAVKPSEVIDVLAGHDALVFPTIIKEMVGLVVMEAFAAGIPVIGSAVGGIAEQVENNKNGFLFKEGSSESLKDSLEKIFINPALLVKSKQNIKEPLPFYEAVEQMHKEYLKALTSVTP